MSDKPDVFAVCPISEGVVGLVTALSPSHRESVPVWPMTHTEYALHFGRKKTYTASIKNLWVHPDLLK